VAIAQATPGLGPDDGAVVHSNVGLMHASMAILTPGATACRCSFSARPVPGTPRSAVLDRLDPHRVRPGGAVRDYTKWTTSRLGARRTRHPARRSDRQYRAGVDVRQPRCRLQEAKIGALRRFRCQALSHADPVLPPDTSSTRRRSYSRREAPGDPRRTRFQKRIVLEAARRARRKKLHARAFTDIKVGAAFPTDHPLARRAACDLSLTRSPSCCRADVCCLSIGSISRAR